MAHFGGWVDEVLMRIIEVINSIPSLLLTILIMMILGNNLFALLVALSVTAWCNTARQVRGMIKQLRETEYVYAAEVLGAKPLRIILKHYVPNMLGILILDTATAIPMFIFTEAGLSFLGIGLPIEVVSWGSMLSLSEKALLTDAWWITVIPGVFLVATLLCITELANVMRRSTRERTL